MHRALVTWSGLVLVVGAPALVHGSAPHETMETVRGPGSVVAGELAPGEERWHRVGPLETKRIHVFLVAPDDVPLRYEARPGDAKGPTPGQSHGTGEGAGATAWGLCAAEEYMWITVAAPEAGGGAYRLFVTGEVPGQLPQTSVGERLELDVGEEGEVWCALSPSDAKALRVRVRGEAETAYDVLAFAAREGRPIMTPIFYAARAGELDVPKVYWPSAVYWIRITGPVGRVVLESEALGAE